MWGGINMEEFEWKELVDGVSDITVEPINAIANYVRELNKNKVDKENGKGLSSNDFTDDLKKRLENNTFEDVIYLDESNPIQGTGLNNIRYKGVYKVSYNNNLYTGILIASHGIYVGDDYEESWSTQIFIDEGANIYYRISVADTYDWNEWEKISVSQEDLESFATKTELANAIGDIETSLENIIKKYGLGGDSQ